LGAWPPSKETVGCDRFWPGAAERGRQLSGGPTRPAGPWPYESRPPTQADVAGSDLPQGIIGLRRIHVAPGSETCAVSLYTLRVIRTFAHKGLEALFRSGSKAGVQAAHASRLRRQLAQLDAATGPQDMGLPGWGLHPLKGELAGHWSIWVNGNWRMTFRFEGTDAVLVDYRDYH
jgi:proteic killer suppression protein